ncbi:MAG TPA: L-arabinose isomerase [Planctomycetota bacterium]|nr:L-arabinose isomerase [Planctomycetota bacterium]
MANFPTGLDIWFVTGSQHLYGPEALAQVASNSQQLVAGLNGTKQLPLNLVFKPVVKTPDEIRQLFIDANADPRCAGLAMWMHTFSPSKMWIGGLSIAKKPMLHLHTQFNRDLPWSTIDMDFMNLNQAAHGDREHGFIHTRMRLERTVVVGHWQDPAVVGRIATWMRATRGWADLQGAKFARFGDNMRNVAVTEGDKVAAEIQLGYAVNYHPVGDLVAEIDAVGDAEAAKLCAVYDDQYAIAKDLQKGGARRGQLADAAKIELGMRAFLEKGGFKGFTNTFEDLHGLKQLPGLAVQRLMADGYGFGAEGDWKTCALLRAMKAIACDLPGGTSWMEDYTYHLDAQRPLVLGAHMLEVCPSIAKGRPTLEAHPLGIGGKADPMRLVFDAKPGPALNATLIDLGARFRLIVNELEVVDPPQPLPKLPTARAVWRALPDFATAAAAWIYSGGAHHASFSTAVTRTHLEDFASFAGIEMVTIGEGVELGQFRKELRWNEAYWFLARGIGR